METDDDFPTLMSNELPKPSHENDTDVQEEYLSSASEMTSFKTEDKFFGDVIWPSLVEKGWRKVRSF